MKLLCLTAPEEDYLADGLLIGLRSLLGPSCIDYPRQDILYANCPGSVRAQVRGGGFTLYGGPLEDIAVDRSRIQSKLQQGFFDLVVFSNIWRQFGLFTQWRPYLNRANTIVLDGEDTPQPYPAAGQYWRRLCYWFLPRAHREFLYFKREWTPDTQFNLWHRLLPKSWRRVLPQSRNLRPISFSIPPQKIVQRLPEKSKLLPRHIVDPEVAERVPESRTAYAFSTEAEYYADLQASKFGITTKRAGWDCLRHYEIAANGCVPCFRNLHLKPNTCAPHGLEPGVNCLSYRDGNDLFQQTKGCDAQVYAKLAAGALAWARANTTVERAKQILTEWRRLADGNALTSYERQLRSTTAASTPE